MGLFRKAKREPELTPPPPPSDDPFYEEMKQLVMLEILAVSVFEQTYASLSPERQGYIDRLLEDEEA